MEHLGHEIYTKPEALDPAFCDELIELFENDDLRSHGTVGHLRSYVPAVKDSTDLYLNPFTHPERYSSIYKKIRNILQRDVDELLNMAEGMKILFKGQERESAWEITSLQIQKSIPGKVCYKPHTDNDSGPDSIIRVLSFIYYISDVEKGGGTKFKNQGITTPCRKGDLVFFPPFWTHIHEGIAPVSPDIKYILSGWIHRVGL